VTAEHVTCRLKRLWFKWCRNQSTGGYIIADCCDASMVGGECVLRGSWFIDDAVSSRRTARQSCVCARCKPRFGEQKHVVLTSGYHVSNRCVLVTDRLSIQEA